MSLSSFRRPYTEVGCFTVRCSLLRVNHPGFYSERQASFPVVTARNRISYGLILRDCSFINIESFPGDCDRSSLRTRLLA